MEKYDLTGIGMTSQRTRDRLSSRLRDQGIYNESVLETMRSLPRHIFVEEGLAHRAYEDNALPIGYNQTISQPYVVAKMTQLLLEGDHNLVLEIGTGSGYQTAVLASLCNQIHSVERIAGFVPKARARLRALRLTNYTLHLADGHKGLNEFGPYDAILCAAAPRTVPRDLLSQLKIGGRLIIPVGDSEKQELKVIERQEKEIKTDVQENVVFVPLQQGIVG